MWSYEDKYFIWYNCDFKVLLFLHYTPNPTKITAQTTDLQEGGRRSNDSESNDS